MKKIMYLLIFCVCVLWVGFIADAKTDGDYEYSITEENTVLITKYKGTSANLVIPDMIEGLPVTEIGKKAFIDNTKLEAVKIGKNVTTIGEHAFYRCTKLAQVDMPDTLEKIDSYAFEYTVIENLILPTALKETATEFIYSPVLKSIYIKNNQYGYYTKDDILYKNTELLIYPPDKEGEVFVIPNGITEICPYAITGCRNLKTLIMSSAVKRIASHGISGVGSNFTIILAHAEKDKIPKVGASAISAGKNVKIKVKSEAIKQEIEETWALNQFEGSIETDAEPFPAMKLTFADGRTEYHIDMELTTTYQCEWKMEPYEATDSVTWESSNITVAIVDTMTGLVQCVGEGEAKITGRDEHGHQVTLNVRGYVSVTDFYAQLYEGRTGTQTVSDTMNLKIAYEAEKSAPYEAYYYVNVVWKPFPEKVINNTKLNYDFLKHVEIINSNPEVMEVIYDKTSDVSGTHIYYRYNINITSLGSSTVYTRFTDYDGTVYETPKVTYHIYMDMSSWGHGNDILKEKIEITGVDGCEFIYNGEAHTPKPLIISKCFNKRGEVLVEGVDYTLRFENNINAGVGKDAECVIIGMGNYTQEFRQQFTINKRELEDCELIWNENSKNLTVKIGNGSLKNGIDYTYYTWCDNANDNQPETTRTVSVTGKGNYKGTVQQTYIIANPNYKQPKQNQIITHKLKHEENVLHEELTVNGHMAYKIRKGMNAEKLTLECNAKTEVRYLVSNPDIAEIGMDGTISIYGTGTCYIIILAEESEEYCESTKYITLDVFEDTGSSGVLGNNNGVMENGSNGINADSSNYNNENVAGNLNSGTSGSVNSVNGSEQNKRSQQILCNKSYRKVYKKNGSFTLNCKAKTACTYKSSNKKIAVVDKNGKVSMKGTGKCRIFVSAKETENYKSSTISVNICILPKKVVIYKSESPKKKTLKISWKKERMADGYEIFYSARKTFKNAKCIKAGKKKTSVSIRKLKSGKKYYIRIRAYKIIKMNGKKEYLYGTYSYVHRTKAVL